jgi:RNase P/RNase MRP subunit p30
VFQSEFCFSFPFDFESNTKMSGTKYYDGCCLSIGAHEKSTNYFGVILEIISPNSKTPKTNLVKATRRTLNIQKQPSTAANKISFEDLKQELVKAREECDIVGIVGDNEIILKRLLESCPELVDLVSIQLESITTLKPTIVRELKSHDIILEISISQLLDHSKRSKCLANARHMIRTFVRRHRGVIDLILTNGVDHSFALRSPQELQDIGMLLGLREQDAKAAVSTSIERLIESSAIRKRRYLATKKKSQKRLSLSAMKKRPAKDDDEIEESRKRVALWNA